MPSPVDRVVCLVSCERRENHSRGADPHIQNWRHALKSSRSSQWAGIILLAASIPAFAAGRPTLNSVVTDSVAFRATDRPQPKHERSVAGKPEPGAADEQRSLGHAGEAQYNDRQRTFLEHRRQIEIDQAGTRSEDRELATEKAKRDLLAD